MSSEDVKALRHDGKPGNRLFFIGHVKGLALQITPKGSRSWLCRVTVDGQRRNIGLGPYPTISLSEAKRQAQLHHAKAYAGTDPLQAREEAAKAREAERAKALTFEEAARRFLPSKQAGLRNKKHAAQWESTLSEYVFPIIGKKPVAEVDVEDVQKVLLPIWLKVPETASRVRGRIEAVLNWARVMKCRPANMANPASWKGNLEHVLPEQRKGGKHPALRLEQAADWFAALRQMPGTAARALELQTLCASRSGEIRGLTWGEVDLERAVITIPGARMKAGEPHRIALSSAAMKLIQATPRTPGQPLVFPGAQGRQLSDMSLSAVVRRMQAKAEAEAIKRGDEPGKAGWRDVETGKPAVPHALRSTFRDFASEIGHFPRELAELALAHRIGSKAEKSYWRGDMLERRRPLMEAWAEFLGA
ncbi:tyrosine-type recombinase/integrase [Paracoccus niistensis]|uniref:Tyrosine-type recombinase/integrase n=1 Tax=Paracoccus niistensis TaxID=632935 RepID=A0ABV6I3J9_9RHOB